MFHFCTFDLGVGIVHETLIVSLFGLVHCSLDYKVRRSSTIELSRATLGPIRQLPVCKRLTVRKAFHKRISITTVGEDAVVARFVKCDVAVGVACSEAKISLLMWDLLCLDM